MKRKILHHQKYATLKSQSLLWQGEDVMIALWTEYQKCRLATFSRHQNEFLASINKYIYIYIFIYLYILLQLQRINFLYFDPHRIFSDQRRRVHVHDIRSCNLFPKWSDIFVLLRIIVVCSCSGLRRVDKNKKDGPQKQLLRLVI